MSLRAILEAHYQRTLAAIDRTDRFSAENEAHCEACDTANAFILILFGA